MKYQKKQSFPRSNCLNPQNNNKKKTEEDEEEEIQVTLTLAISSALIRTNSFLLWEPAMSLPLVSIYSSPHKQQRKKTLKSQLHPQLAISLSLSLSLSLITQKRTKLKSFSLPLPLSVLSAHTLMLDTHSASGTRMKIRTAACESQYI